MTNKWKHRIENYTFVSERIVMLILKINGSHTTIINIYAPEKGKREETKNLYD